MSNLPETVITITIKPRAGRRAKSGHPWMFSNEIEHPDPKPEPGSIVRVIDDAGRFVATGIYNPHSLIAIRILSRKPKEEVVSVDWFAQAIRQALALRTLIYPGRDSYRLVYGESDALPGVIIDRLESAYVVQILSAGMERCIDELVEAMKVVLNPTTIVLRNDHDKRGLEGLPSYTKTILGDEPGVIEMEEFGVRFGVDVSSGQKTGHFFDQAENRAALAPFAKGKETLDLFCYTGGWALHLLHAGAESAIAIDSSEPAIATAQQNAERNGFSDKMECVKSDVFQWLSSERAASRRFDVVVVDPPAFAKGAKQVNKALRGYEDVNRQAIHLLRNQGILCACSCSYFVKEDDLIGALQKAAHRERKRLQILEVRGQSKDHPALASMPESRYLNCIIAAVSLE
ncbi:MAG: class I SAM-dependent rRNA methyltransferase [Candidatus Hinthialibacter antarcticus]|nr:class I SAM-dependent rRNA methyltransferase [Candidatus Hinthialibacter antarcticus]